MTICGQARGSEDTVHMRLSIVNENTIYIYIHTQRISS